VGEDDGYRAEYGDPVVEDNRPEHERLEEAEADDDTADGKRGREDGLGTTTSRDVTIGDDSDDDSHRQCE